MAVVADSVAIASASAASPSALAVDDQSSPTSKRAKQQQHEQPT